GPSAPLRSDRPMSRLFRGGGNFAVVRPDFESQPYFGAGWSGIDRVPTGGVRHGSSGATLLLPLEAASSYRLTLDLAASEPTTINVSADDVIAGACEVRDHVPCEVAVPPGARRAAVTAVTLSVRGPARRDVLLTFRGARI